MTAITVSQLNRYVKALLEEDKNLTPVLVSGEISNFTHHYKSGHLYLSLKDENALVRAVMFRGAAQKLAFTPQNGMKVIVRARVSLYERDGAYQLYIDAMQPDGVGALQVAFEQLKEKLAQEGLFDANRKRPIPRYPRAVGVITSPTGAAVRDIFNVLGRRYPMAKVVFAPVLVQGEDAPPQIVSALARMAEVDTVDVIIVGRGGGSLEDLWAFNDERVARAVSGCAKPVISAVGHETDFTICDFAADLRAPTPSAAAELAVPDTASLLRLLDDTGWRLTDFIQAKLQRESHRLSSLREKRCLSSPLFYVEERQMRLDLAGKSLAAAVGVSVHAARQRLAALSASLDALSPLKVLARGYSIVYKGDAVVKSAGEVQTGDRLRVRVKDGEISAAVT